MNTRTVPIEVSDEYIKGAFVPVGAAGSHNDVVLELHFSPLWDGLTKKITWLDANGANPTLTILTAGMRKNGDNSTYLVPIPAEPKAYAGDMAMAIKGSTVAGGVETRATLSASCTFRVLPSDYDAQADESSDVNPTQAAQLQAEIDGILDTISDAGASAQAAAGSATAAAGDAYDASASAASAESAKTDAAASKAAAESASTQASQARDEAGQKASDAEGYAGAADGSACTAEGYAVGELRGAPVGEESIYYHNNAKYFKEQAETAQEAAEGAQAETEAILPELMQSVSNAMLGSMNGVITRADDISPLAHDLRITQYGQCVQSGASITGKAAGLTLHGKNLIPPITSSDPRISVDSTTGVWTITNTTASQQYPTSAKFTLPAGTYVFQSADAIVSNIALLNGSSYLRTLSPSNTKSTPFTLAEASANINIMWVVPAQSTISVRLQIELNSTSDYEVYKSQSQTVTDSDGNAVTLFGVPVTSDGNITIDGQQYIADTVEGTTLTRRVGHIASYNGEVITTPYISSTGALTTGADVYYVLASPTTETVTLTPDALSAYCPTSTVIADAYTETGYNRDINKAFTELAAAIVALGGTI